MGHDRMVLIYSHITSSRLQYICRFIFKELLGTDFSITIDPEEFKVYKGIRINYSRTTFNFTSCHIPNHSLLFERDIKPQAIECVEVNNYTTFFKTAYGNHPFDIFAASFYLLSRYEEYLPHKNDIYGRYAHENSLAFQQGFLHLPLINIWVKDFYGSLKSKYSTFNFQLSTFVFEPTYDIDIAWSYKYKGPLRNIGGFWRSPSVERIKVLMGSKNDPFDSYAWLDSLHKKNKLKPVYFFLLAEKHSHYDKNISPHKEAMWRLVSHHAKNYGVGLHPSWQSGDNPYLLKKEKEQLEAMIGQATKNSQTGIIKSRQHYIRFEIPVTFRNLINCGITHDYSMGYGSINGFRASVGTSFFWYDLENEEETALCIHPFCFMDANSFYEQEFNAQKAYDELMHYLQICKSNGCTLTTIWHNNFLGTAPEFAGWRETYEQFIAQALQ